MIIPSIFALGSQDDLLAKGPSLMFAVLPRVFDKMAGGTFVGAAFFVMVLFAALTSSISLMETVVSILQDKLKWNRKITCLVTFIGCLVIGAPSSLGYGPWAGVKIIGMQFLDFFDFISNSVLMPIVALFTCIFVGYIIKPKAIIEEAELEGNKFKAKGLFTVVIKYFAPICIVLILVSSILSAFGIMNL